MLSQTLACRLVTTPTELSELTDRQTDRMRSMKYVKYYSIKKGISTLHLRT